MGFITPCPMCGMTSLCVYDRYASVVELLHETGIVNHAKQSGASKSIVCCVDFFSTIHIYWIISAIFTYDKVIVRIAKFGQT